MFDRLVYLLFFIFLGAGLFLVYQGLQGLGYLGPSLLPLKPVVKVVRPSELVNLKVKTSKQKITFEDIEAVAFVVKYLPESDLQIGCDYFNEHYQQWSVQKGEFDHARVLSSVNDVMAALKKLSPGSLCLKEISLKSFQLVDKFEDFDWKTEAGSIFLESHLRVLGPTGRYSFIANLYSKLIPVLRMRLPHYRNRGWAIERSLCDALKKMGKPDQCQHIYPAFGSPSLQLYTLATRKVYDDQWDRLGLYADRMRKIPNPGEYVGYAEYIEGLYKFYYKKDFYKAERDFRGAVGKRESFSVFASAQEHLYLIRSLRALKEFNKAKTTVDSFLSKLDSQSQGPSYFGMALVLQKLMLAIEMNQPPLVAELQKKFNSYKPNDPFADHYSKAVEALIQKNQNYKAGIKNNDLLEVQKILNQ